MSLLPLLTAPLAIQIHALAACIAILTGPVALYQRRRGALHKGLGHVWVVAMACVALSSFFIHSFAVIGPFSPLHGLALLTLWSLWRGVACARAGHIAAHRAVFRNLYWLGLMIAGLVNFLPGRTVNRMLLPGAPDLGLAVIAAGAVLAALILARHRIAAASRQVAPGA